MNERLRVREMEPTEKARIMGFVVVHTASGIRNALRAGNPEGIKKEVAFERTLSNLPLELSGIDLTMTGDNWVWRDPKKTDEGAIMPGMTASIALVEKDRNGNIVSCAATLVDKWGDSAVVAGENGVFVFRDRKIQQVKSINPVYLNQPSQVFLFGQKMTDYWTAMGSIVAEMNEGGYKTMNDMGLYHVLRIFFDNSRNGVLVPPNAVLIEPNNKFKNEVPAFIAKRLKETAFPNEIQIKDMRGNDIEDKDLHAGSVGDYESVGYVIAATIRTHDEVMTAFGDAVLSNEDFRNPPSDDPRFARLRQELQNWKNSKIL